MLPDCNSSKHSFYVFCSVTELLLVHEQMMAQNDDLGDSLIMDDGHWLQTLGSSLHKMQVSEQLCDVRIMASDGEITWAHSCILAASSPVFASALTGSQCRDTPHSCHLAVSTQTVKYILRFIYTGKLMVPKSHFTDSDICHCQ